MKIHEKYISRCIQLAKNGLGTTFPNPMVGSVIVHGAKIIGEGHTSPYGGSHAEVNAINSVKDKQLLKKGYLVRYPGTMFPLWKDTSLRRPDH